MSEQTRGAEAEKAGLTGLVGQLEPKSLVEGLQAVVKQAGPFFLFVIKRYQKDRVLRVAASLSYTSLLAMVPLLAMAFSILTAFPAFDGVQEQVQAFVFENFAPTAGGAVQDQVTAFVDKAGNLGAVGVVGLSVTAILLLVTIEEAMNAIFRVERARSVLSKLIVYWTVLTLGPLLIGASFSLSGFLFAITHWAGEVGAEQAVGLFLRGMPIMLAALAFALLYLTVPNRPVSVWGALLGGVVAAAMFGGLRYGFTLYVTSNDTYQNIYGALAALPLFLIWLYLSWAVVLFGAVTAAAMPEWRQRWGIRRLDEGPTAVLEIGMAVLAALKYQAAVDGRGLTRTGLLKQIGAPEGSIAPVLAMMEEARVIARDEKRAWRLARDLTVMTLQDFIKALNLGLVAPEEDKSRPAWRVSLSERLEAAQREEEALFDVPLADLLAEPKPPAPSS